MGRYKKPIYQIRKETVLATDTIKPYGDRIEVSSESKRAELALKLLDTNAVKNTESNT